MKNKAIAILSFIVFYSIAIKAQVQVREEPRHRPVLENKYIRLLDVWLPPGDTTLFHIHSTPSVFVILSGAVTGLAN
jgi:quercetin dioxygenase-like cupin family protein